MSHPLYHTYPFSSINGYYYNHPWSFYFPRYRGWGYSYGFGCYFCYYPVFYSTPLGWAYGPYASYLGHYYNDYINTDTFEIYQGEGAVEVNIQLLFK